MSYDHLADRLDALIDDLDEAMFDHLREAAARKELVARDDKHAAAEQRREQIAEAMKRLTSPTESERVEAVEQLGAYPNPQTEATLSQLLAGDSSADVRNAAALSLGSLEAPSTATVSTLLSGLKDQSEDVRFSSLSTLEDFMLSQEEESPLYQSIRTGLQDMGQSTGLPDDLRDSINEVLKDPNSQLAPGNEPAVR